MIRIIKGSDGCPVMVDVDEDELDEFIRSHCLNEGESEDSE